MSNLSEALENVDAGENPFEGNNNFTLDLNEEAETRAFEKPTLTTEALVTERGKTHGDFADHARITQRLKDVILVEQVKRTRRGQPRLTDTQKESLDMILHKIGRIVAGEPGFPDHWDDIAGYAKIARPDV